MRVGMTTPRPLTIGDVLLARLSRRFLACPEASAASPYVPTPTRIVSELLALAQIEPGELVIDLGSGDGRLVITAAKRYGARGRGIDNQPHLVALAKDNARREGVADRVTFVDGDLFEASLADADVVTLYLTPATLTDLIPKCLAGLRPGARVVSHDYPLEPWVPEHVVELEYEEKVPISGTARTVLYRYVAPARVERVAQVHGPAALSSRPVRAEMALLLRCAGTATDRGAGEAGGEMVTPGLDWGWLRSAASRHRLLPLLYHHLAGVSSDVIPSTARAAIRGDYLANAGRVLRLVGWLTRLVRLLEAEGIPVIASGGPTLAAIAYGSPLLRTSGDLDLLVHRRQLAGARRRLRAEGVPSEVALRSERDAVHGLPLRPLHPWERTEEVVLGECMVRTLGPEPLLLILCAHGQRRAWTRLAGIVDIAELVRQHPALDWDWIWERAETLGHARALTLGLGLVADLLRVPLPLTVQDRVQADAPAVPLRHRVRDHLLAGSPPIRLDTIEPHHITGERARHYDPSGTRSTPARPRMGRARRGATGQLVEDAPLRGRLFFRGYDSGFSNNRMSLDIGIALAHLTGRVFCPYNFQLPLRSSLSGLALGRDFPRFSSTPELFEIPIPWSAEHLTDPRPHVPRAVRLAWPPVSESMFCLPATLADDHARFEDFRNQRRHVCTIDALEDDATDLQLDVHSLGFYSHFFHLDDERRGRLIDLMRRVRPGRPYRELADRFVESLGPFNAIHVRRGDFLSQGFTPRSASVGGHEVVANLAPLMSRDQLLVISTDGSVDNAADRELFAPIRRHFRQVLFLDRCLLDEPRWRREFLELPLHDDTVLALVAQLVASRAQVFAGTLFSTFTALIHRLRGFEGRTPNFLYCYCDFLSPLVRFENCEFLPVGEGHYSWNRVRFPVAPGTYSWLREWPEAFDSSPPTPPVTPVPEGTLHFGAATATVHGQTARYEVGNGQDNIGYWTDPDDHVSWELAVPETLRVRVEVRYACAEGCAGSRYRVGVEGGEAVEGTVHCTGSWATFSPWLALGEIRVPGGRSRLKVRVRHMPSLAVMNLQAVRLVPTG
jgi:SAM-dependent methyltransferase